MRGWPQVRCRRAQAWPGGLLMHRRIVSLGFALLVAGFEASAHGQCGATVSGCRQCHEIDQQAPVLADGRPWHRDHAFGDFCAECHGGERTATDSTAAHQTLVDPLGDFTIGCGAQMCHGAKATALADGYRRTARPRAVAQPAGQPVAPYASGRPKPRAAQRPPPAKPDHNATAAAVAVALAVAGGAYVWRTERRRRALEAKP